MAFNAFMPGEHNYQMGKPMQGMPGAQPAPQVAQAQPQKRQPIMNAFSKIFEYGAPEAFQQGRDKRLTRDLGNALADGNYSGAAEMAFRSGKLEAGLKLRGEAETRRKTETDEQRKTEAQGTYQLFNSMQPAQINDYAMQDPVGFERMTGMSSEEYLQSAKQMQQYGMMPDQFRQFVIQRAQAELGMESKPTEYGLDLVPVLDPETGQTIYVQSSKAGGVRPVEGYVPPAPEPDQRPWWAQEGGGVDPAQLANQAAGRAGGVNVYAGAAGAGQYQGLPDGTIIEPPPGTSPLPRGQTWVLRNGQPAVEAVSGSEAEREAQGAATAKTALDNTFDNIMQSYLDLQDKGAIRDTEATTGQNISAFMQSSQPGRVIGKAIGSEAESLRETIEALQPSITQAIMSQPGMSARSMDSQRELEFFMRSITTPTADVWANFTTLHALDKRFGSGQLMNRMLQMGRITPEDYTRITRSPRVGTVINQMDRKIGELFVTGDQGQLQDLSGLVAQDGSPVTEEDIQETMAATGLTREQIIARLRGQ